MLSSRKILKNMLSLSVAEAASKGIMFITTAYLARTLLDNHFGIIGFANSVIVYFWMIVNLGFNTLGTREIASTDSNSERKRLVNGILTIRLLLSVLAGIGIFIFPFFLDKPIIYSYAIWATGLTLFSQATMLDWYYQGIEKMEVLAIRQLVTGVVNLIGVMVLVHKPEDVIVALLINSAAAIINAIWMIMYYFKTVEKIKFSFDVPLWKKLIKPAIPITFSNFFVTLLNTFNILILGIYFTDASLAGQYNAAFKIMVFAILPTAIIQGAFFPVLSKTYGTDDFLKVAKKYSVLIFLAGAIISAGFYTFSEFIIITAFSAEYKMAIDIMKILMLTSFIVYLNTSLSPQLIAIKKEKSMMYAMGIGAVISVVLNIVLIPRYGAIGAAWVTVLSEFSLLIGLAIAYFAAIKKLFIFDIIKASALAALSCYIGYHVADFGIHEIIAGLISFFIFIALNLITKTFSIAEVKGYFVK